MHENSDHLEKEHIAPLEEGFEISFASYADFYLQQCPPCSAEDSEQLSPLAGLAGLSLVFVELTQSPFPQAIHQ